MTPINVRGVRLGLRESWEEYRARHGGRFTRQDWREEGRLLLNWKGPGHPCPTSNGRTPIEDDDQGEARPVAS